MCIQQAIGAVLKVGGTVLKGAVKKKAAKEAKRLTLDAIRQQNEARDRQNQQIQERLARLKASNPDAQKAESEGSFLAQLKKARERGMARQQQLQGVGSEAFGDFSARGLGAEDALSEKLSGLFAGIDSAGRQRQAEGQDTANLGSVLADIAAAARRRAAINQLRISGVRPNGFGSLVAGELGKAGDALLSNGGSGGGGFGGGK